MAWISSLLGFLAGVAVNWCADALPAGRPLHRPVCDVCGHRRTLLAWSGLSAYLSGRYRCPNCGSRVPVRNVVVELSTVALFALCWFRGGTALPSLLDALYGTILILILTTDIEHRLIQHVVTLPAITLALVGAFVNPAFDSPRRALLGGAIGLVATFAVYLAGGLFARLLGWIRGQPISEVAFGFGDVTLNTFIGLVVGAPEIIFSMVIGFFVGGVFAALYLLVQGLLRRRYSAFTAIPYGPFLILGGATMLCFGNEFMTWYSSR